MTSAIDPTKPTSVQAYTADVRANFATAASEISALQAQIATLQSDIATLKARRMVATSSITTNPPNTTSAAYVTAGLAVQFTPHDSTRGMIDVDGQLGNTGNGSASNLQLYYGTGLSPTVGTLVATTNGQAIGGVVNMLAAKPNDFSPFAISALLTGLVPGTLYWLDVAFRAQSGTATLTEISLTAFELLDPLP